MLSERDVTTLWRQLFKEQEITGSTLTKAKALICKLSPESPLRLRLSAELDEMRAKLQCNSKES
jgi:hypothetical protein